MPAYSVERRLSSLVSVACEDALFAIVGSGPRALAGFAKRRADAHDRIARGEIDSVATAADRDRWMLAMARASATVSVPWFVPMREAIDDGLSLDAEPRGLRAVIPLGNEARVERIRQEGAFAVRVLRAVSAADATVGEHELRGIDLLIAALALGDDDQRVLRAEGPMPIAAIATPPDLAPELARAIVRGAWESAASDGLHEHERAAVLEVAGRLGVDPETAASSGVEAERAIGAQLTLGYAEIDAIRYVAAPIDREDLHARVLLIVELAIPPSRRSEVLHAINTRQITPLGTDHALDRASRATVLAAAWAAVLAADPTMTMRARLRERHDRVGADLGSESAAGDARESVEEYLETILSRGVAASGA